MPNNWFERNLRRQLNDALVETELKQFVLVDLNLLRFVRGAVVGVHAVNSAQIVVIIAVVDVQVFAQERRRCRFDMRFVAHVADVDSVNTVIAVSPVEVICRLHVRAGR